MVAIVLRPLGGVPILPGQRKFVYPMFNSITNAQDGFHRHHNAKPSVRRSVLFYQFLPSICLGGASIPGGGENTQQPIFILL